MCVHIYIYVICRQYYFAISQLFSATRQPYASSPDRNPTDLVSVRASATEPSSHSIYIYFFFQVSGDREVVQNAGMMLDMIHHSDEHYEFLRSSIVSEDLPHTWLVFKHCQTVFFQDCRKSFPGLFAVLCTFPGCHMEKIMSMVFLLALKPH